MSNKTKNVSELIAALADKRAIWVLSGAGISAPSGIPTYRDRHGQWKASNPIQHNEFVQQKSSQQRYWARSMVGFAMTHLATPNPAHEAVTRLQSNGLTSQITTQNVDRLHSVAGAEKVIDLHGRLDQVICLDCGVSSKRAEFQPRLVALNPDLTDYAAKLLPDGDAAVDDFDMSHIKIPACNHCGGTIMPDVVFFGGTVPKPRVEAAFKSLSEADCILVIGSSLTVYSGFRFPRWAHQNGLPLYAINEGEMRGAELFDLILQESCEVALPQIVEALDCATSTPFGDN